MDQRDAAAATPYVLQIIGAAGRNPAVAKRFVHGFSDPTDFQHWFLDTVKVEKYLAET